MSVQLGCIADDFTGATDLAALLARIGHPVRLRIGVPHGPSREEGRHRFVGAGGETSGAVMRALGISRLDVGRENAPGVPWTFSENVRAPVVQALKSGNVAGPGLLSNTATALEAT